MSFDRPVLGAPDGLFRWSARRRLEHETRRLERVGSTVIRIEPDASSRAAMGLNPMSDRRAHRVVSAAMRETARMVAEGRIPSLGVRAGSPSVKIRPARGG
jgi:HAMP domain-containing protein